MWFMSPDVVADSTPAWVSHGNLSLGVEQRLHSYKESAKNRHTRTRCMYIYANGTLKGTTGYVDPN